MFISRETYEKLLVAHNKCLSFSSVPSEYIELFDIVGDLIDEIEEYHDDDEQDQILERQELEDFCQDDNLHWVGEEDF